MKSFREFLSEDAVKAQKAWQDWMNANPHEFQKGGRFYERGSSEKTTKAAKEFMKGYMKTGKPPAGFEVRSTRVSGADVRGTGSQTPPQATQTPPKPPRQQTPKQPSGSTQAPSRGTQAPPRSTQTPPKQPGPTPGADARAEAERVSREARQRASAQTRQRASNPGADLRSEAERVAKQASQRTSSVKPPSSSPSTPSSAPRKVGFRNFVGRTAASTVADVAADAAINRIKDPTTRERVRTVKDLATFASTPVASSILSIPGSSPQPGIRNAGKYRIQRRIDTSPAGSGFNKFLATGQDKKGLTYNDPNQKIMGYRRDRVGSSKPEDKAFRVGAAKLGGQIVPARWGSVAGEKKVGTQAQAQSTQGVRQAREISSKSGTYGTKQGSGLSGIGGQTFTSKDKKGSAFMTTGAGAQRKTVQLSKTQLVRDPKSGKQVVGDLAFKGGKATYVARPSIASRDTNLFSRLSRATGIGGQREKDAAAAKQEYRTALKSTQSYQRKLGITPKVATAQKLPGAGVGPKK